MYENSFGVSVLRQVCCCWYVTSSLWFVLHAGRSDARDNTNADVETRAIWIQLAQRFGLSIRCIYFTAHPKLCEHNDTVRALNQDVFNPEKRTILPHSAFSNFSSRFQEPQLKEGFHDIVRVDFTVSLTSLSR